NRRRVLARWKTRQKTSWATSSASDFEPSTRSAVMRTMGANRRQLSEMAHSSPAIRPAARSPSLARAAPPITSDRGALERRVGMGVCTLRARGSALPGGNWSRNVSNARRSIFLTSRTGIGQAQERPWVGRAGGSRVGANRNQQGSHMRQHTIWAAAALLGFGALGGCLGRLGNAPGGDATGGTMGQGTGTGGGSGGSGSSSGAGGTTTTGVPGQLNLD